MITAVSGDCSLAERQDLEPVHLGHAKVGDDRVEWIAPDRFDGRRSALGQGDLVAGLLQRDGQQVAHALLVVHHQDPCLAHVFLVSPGRSPAFAVGRPAVASGCSSASTSEFSASSPAGSVGRGEVEDERSALAHAAPHLDGAAVLLDDPIDERKADTAALRLGREEWLEDMGEVIRRRCPGPCR